MKKNFDIQTREQPMLARLRKLNWQTSSKKEKNAPFLGVFRWSFCFPYFRRSRTSMIRAI